ncbi:cytochrome c oxidase assembly protein [Cereibacter azotoformans]|uniref:Cytochrome c oxidase assembly protein n=1 Tax=Cereibacter sphaeroides (strain ATCC 17025 / ATH 2.4.3) TaxID=349102 RepID=A4WX90_CERS5|nr:cytochrome c oxidase assembly protein [Cereibacter azotoformans]
MDGAAGGATWRGGVVPLGAGLAALLALWGGPLPDLARISFAWHMILHLGVILGAAPLVAIGLSQMAPLRVQWPVALAVAVSLVELAVVWGWHAPRLHEAAALDPLLFRVQQASFLVAGVLVWLPGLAPGKAAAAAGLLAMLFSLMHMTMLGVLLTLAPRLLYAPEICGTAFGLDPLGNQRLGGAMMAVAGLVPYLGGAALFTRRLTRAG